MALPSYLWFTWIMIRTDNQQEIGVFSTSSNLSWENTIAHLGPLPFQELESPQCHQAHNSNLNWLRDGFRNSKDTNV